MNTYSVIPTIILVDTELKPSAKLLYCFLNSFSNKYGHTAIDNATLQKCLGTGERNIQLLIKELEAKGYIKVVVNNGRRVITPLMTFKQPKKRKDDDFTSGDNNIIEWEEA